MGHKEKNNIGTLNSRERLHSLKSRKSKKSYKFLRYRGEDMITKVNEGQCNEQKKGIALNFLIKKIKIYNSIRFGLLSHLLSQI